MWHHEQRLEAVVAPEAIWALWTHVEGWPRWNGDIERIAIDGPFAVGSEITMTTAGGETVRLRLAEVQEDALFVDEADFDGMILRTTHRIDRLDNGRVQIVYRMEITGPPAAELGPRVGPHITADFPQTMAALVKAAQEG